MNRIKELREAAGIFQKDFAEVLHVKPNTVSSWERGRTEPDFDSLKKMAQLFGCTIDYILGGESAPVIYKDVTAEDAELLHRFRALNPYGRAELLRYLDYLQTRPEFQPGDNTAQVV